jgi:ethanolaminephosphotransferase
MKTRRDRGEQARVALLGLFPFFSSWTVIAAYLMLQPHILYHHLVPFVFYVGLINAYSVGQIITAHLVVMDFPYQNIIAFPLTFGIIDALGPRLQQTFGFGWPSALGEDIYQVAFMFTCLGLGVGVYGSFVVDVIVTICDYLDIWCLTIKHPQAQEAGSARVTRSTRKKKVG